MTKASNALVDELAENMAIYAQQTDETPFREQAASLIQQFEATEGRAPTDYLEIEQWSRTRLDKSGRLLVVK